MSSYLQKPKQNNFILKYMKPLETAKPNGVSPSNFVLVEKEEEDDIEDGKWIYKSIYCKVLPFS